MPSSSGGNILKRKVLIITVITDREISVKKEGKGYDLLAIGYSPKKELSDVLITAYEMNRISMDTAAILSGDVVLGRQQVALAHGLDSFQQEKNESLHTTGKSEHESKGATIKRMVGWISLLFEIPTMLLQPFIVRNVWPEKLGIPFHDEGSLLYISQSLSSTVSLVQVAAYAALLFAVEIVIASGELKSRSRAQNFRYMGSRVLYDAFYCLATYKAFSYLLYFESPSDSTRICKIDASMYTTAEHQNVSSVLRLVEADIDIARASLGLFVIIFSFWGAIQYTIIEKNAANPAFMWLPSYNIILFVGKSIASAVTGTLRHQPGASLPFLLTVNITLACVTFKLQPCQGKGRRPNNMRFAAFVIGSWTSFLGLLCLVFGLNEAVTTKGDAALCWCFLFASLGALLWFATKINNSRAKLFAIPDAPIASMLEASHSKYHRRVAAHAVIRRNRRSQGSQQSVTD